MSHIMTRGAIGGKTGKTAVLPWFCKIEHGGSSGGAPPCYGGLSLLRRMRCAGGTPDVVESKICPRFNQYFFLQIYIQKSNQILPLEH